MNLEPIDTTTTAGKAEVMWLAAEGRRVAYRNAKSRNAIWHEAGEDPMWNWYGREYAIIAEPVGPDEVWMVINTKNIGHGPYPSEELARDRAQSHGGDAVRYIRADLAGRDE